MNGPGAPAIIPFRRKLLGFTNNRQDAALQAGHFNDFVFVTRLRAAILAGSHAPVTRAQLRPRRSPGDCMLLSLALRSFIFHANQWLVLKAFRQAAATPACTH